MKRFADSLSKKKGHQATAWLQDVHIDLPQISQRTRAQKR
jgi:hypothetical protein